MQAAADSSLRLAVAVPARAARQSRLMATWLLILGLGFGLYAVTLTEPFAAGARIVLFVLAAVCLLGALMAFRSGAKWSRDAREAASTGR